MGPGSAEQREGRWTASGTRTYPRPAGIGGCRGWWRWGGLHRIKADRPEPVPNPMPFAAIVQRIRSFSLSIGQLTFASFALLLAMIVMTSVASVVSIRHFGATFAELQRLQSLGDVAEEIDRRLNELRLAARDFVTDPDARSEEHTSELQSHLNLVCRLLLEKKKK